MITIKEILEPIDVDYHDFLRVLKFLDERCPKQYEIDKKLIPTEDGYCIGDCASCWLKTLENMGV